MTALPGCGGRAELGLPDCITGPAGRLRFVAQQLAQRWRHRRPQNGLAGEE